MKKEHTVEREGKTFVLYAGLLDMAHERGLKQITTTLIQIPNELNGTTAICHATVELQDAKDGTISTFTGIGDAAPGNVTRMMVPHLIRMAETRAKARALRDAVNVGVAALEELGDFGEAGDDLEPPRHARTAPAPRQLRPTHAPVGGPPDDDGAPPPELEGAVVQYAPRPQPGDAEPKGAGYAEAQTRAARAEAGGPAATPKQIETIARMARAAGREIATEGLTRAQASDIISKLIGDMGEGRGR